jgi:cytosine/adenosine deaminase-related metal-dependent hydrolase
VGEISVGRRADLVVLDETHPGLAGRADDAALDSWVFTGDGRMVREVWVGGRRVVIDGRCIARDEVEGRWRRVAPTLAAWARHAGSDSGASRRTSRW